MVSSFSTDFLAFLPVVARNEVRENIYNENRNRVYSLCFWLTDNELAAEELSTNVFVRAFGESSAPSAEYLDRTLVALANEFAPIGLLTLDCAEATEVVSVRKNTKRVHLERAVVQLPATEKMIYLLHDGEGYSRERVARTLGLSTVEVQLGLHQARLRLRELLAEMV